MTVNQTQASATQASTGASHGGHHGRAKGHVAGQDGGGAMGFFALLAVAGAQDEPPADFSKLLVPQEVDAKTSRAKKGAQDVPDAVDLAGLLAHTAHTAPAAPAAQMTAAAQVQTQVQAAAQPGEQAAASGVALAGSPAVAWAAPDARSQAVSDRTLVETVQQASSEAPDAGRQAPATVVQGGRDAFSRLGWVEAGPVMSTAGYLSSIGRGADAAGLADGTKDLSAGVAASPGLAARPRGQAALEGRAGRGAPAGTESLQWAPAAAVVQAAAAEAGAGSSDASSTPQERAALPGAILRETQERPFHAEQAAAVDVAAPADPAQLQASAEELLAQQVSYLVAQKTQTAELRLDSLGGQPVEVSIALSGNEAHVEFRSDHAQAREMLNDAAPQLADLLRAEGIVLGGVSVGTSGHGRSQHQPTAPSEAPAGERGGSKPQETAPAAPIVRRPTATAGRSLDLFV